MYTDELFTLCVLAFLALTYLLELRFRRIHQRRLGLIARLREVEEDRQADLPRVLAVTGDGEVVWEDRHLVRRPRIL